MVTLFGWDTTLCLTRTLNWHQAPWSTFLANFEFEILFWTRTQYIEGQCTSSRSKFELQLGDDAYDQQSQCFLKSNQFRTSRR